MGLVNWIIKALCGAGGIAGVGITLLYFFQEKLLYVPHVPGTPKVSGGSDAPAPRHQRMCMQQHGSACLAHRAGGQ